MPVKVQADLPVKEILESENIFVMDETRAVHQDIRPLKIMILNLMPLKEDTELQLLRSLSNTSLQVDVTFLMVASHEAKNTSTSHLNTFYVKFEDVRKNYYDGMIITGAPVEQMEFEEVDYWDELTKIMDWTNTHVTSTMFLCWGALGALWHLYQIPKRQLGAKLFGVFKQRLCDEYSFLTNGFDEVHYMPHSRHAAIDTGAFYEKLVALRSEAAQEPAQAQQ